MAEGEQRKFENNCWRLREDDPTLTFIDDGPASSVGETCAINHIMLGQSLMGNSTLNTLALSHPILEERAARVLATGIAQSNPETLVFLPSSERTKQPEGFLRILFEGVRSMQNLKNIIDFGATSQQLVVLCECISSLHSLRELTIFCAKGCQSGLWLSQILTRTSSLTDLSLVVRDSGGIGFIGITLLAHGLRCNASITTLHRASSTVDDKCLELFLELWQPSSPIRELSLFNNEIGLRGARQLLRAIADHPTMHVLDLLCNENIGYEGLRMIGEETLHQTSLTDISVGDCVAWVKYPNPDCEDARAQDKASLQAGRALLEGVKRNVRIKKLDVSNLHLLPLGVENEIGFYANLNKMGRYLLSTDHELASTIWCYILAKCQSQSVVDNKESIIYFFLSAQPSLVQQAAME
jgi:hypothetical protein